MRPAGDLAQLDRLVTQHLPSALRFAIRLTGGLHAAEDLLQEALLRATTYWTGLRDEGAFRNWLYRIIVNALRDDVARKRPEISCSGDGDRSGHSSSPAGIDDARDDAAGPHETVLQRELGDVVARCINRLPPRQREVLVLMTYEHCTAVEAAAILEIRVENVYATLHLARTRLKELLTPYLQDQC